jgi:hypothetical protein
MRHTASPTRLTSPRRAGALVLGEVLRVMGGTPRSGYASLAATAKATSIAPHVTRSKGNRQWLRRIHRRALSSSIVVGSARSNASALGMKSNPDQIRITAWLTNPTP